MDFGKRLRDLRLKNGITQKELGAKIGVTEVTIGNWERGVKLPGLRAVLALGEALDVSIDVLTGFQPSSDNRKGATPSDITETSLLEKFRQLDKYGKQAVEMLCNIEYARFTAKNRASSARSESKVVVLPERRERERYIPAYTSPSAAGIAVPLEGNEFEMILADKSVPEDADFAVWIQGDSMYPYIEDGEMVFVNKDAEINNGDVGIFSVDGAMYCKQYYRDRAGNVYLLSANPDRKSSNVYLSADSGSTFRASGKVILGQAIPLPDYFDI